MPPGPAESLPPTARVARLFDEVAATYDAVGVDFFGPIAEGLLEALAVRPGEAVADLGCGKGALLLAAADAVGPAGRVMGLDLSPAMAAAARAEAEARGLRHVEVRVADVQAPDLPLAAFDVVAASLVLFFLPDPAAALRSWCPSLVPGGRLGISTFGAQDDVWRSVDDVFTPYLPPAMLDARTSGGTGPFASDAGVERLLADAGLADVRTELLDLPVAFRDTAHWREFSMSTGQRGMWAMVPDGERPAVRAEAERRLAAAADEDGRIVLRQQVRYTVGVLGG